MVWYYTVGYGVSMLFVHSCLSTVKGRTTVTANVQWDDGTTGEFIVSDCNASAPHVQLLLLPVCVHVTYHTMFNVVYIHMYMAETAVQWCWLIVLV